MRQLRIFLGLCIWAAAAWGLWWCAHAPIASGGTVREELAPELWRFAAGKRTGAELRLDQASDVAVGDPIFHVDDQGEIRQVGEIRLVQQPNSAAPTRRATTHSAEAVFYAGAPPIGADAELTYHHTPDNMEWALKTLLPPEKRVQVADEISAAFEEHHEEVLAALRPLVEASLRDALTVVEEDLPAALARHRDELEDLGTKYQREIVQKEIVPLVRNEVWPVVRRHAEPTADRVGRELWQKVSLWRFGWRALYDKTPLLPDKQLVRKEWQRYVDDDALPILEKHSDDFVRVVQRIMADVARNEEVQAVARRSFARLIDDPQLRQVLWQIVREVIVDNPRMREVLKTHFSTDNPLARQALQIAGERLEPTVRRIGDLLIGTRDGGITPEFARVLRNQVLLKDRRWFLLASPGKGEAAQTKELVLTVRRGDADAPNPFVTQAGRE